MKDLYMEQIRLIRLIKVSSGTKVYPNCWRMLKIQIFELRLYILKLKIEKIENIMKRFPKSICYIRSWWRNASDYWLCNEVSMKVDDYYKGIMEESGYQD